MVIYKITNAQNSKCYVGKASNYKKRFNQHKNMLRKNKHCNQHLQSAWNKYGEDSFTFEVIEKFDPKFNFDIDKLESYWIFHYNSSNPTKGYNKTLGGEGTLGRKCTDKHKKLMSDKMSGEKHPQYGKRGELSHNYKRRPSDICLNKARETNKGNSYRLGSSHTLETKQKISNSHLGKKQTTLQVELRSKKLRKRFLNTTTKETFTTAAEAAKSLGLSPKSFSRWFRNPNKNKNILIQIKD